MRAPFVAEVHFIGPDSDVLDPLAALFEACGWVVVRATPGAKPEPKGTGCEPTEYSMTEPKSILEEALEVSGNNRQRDYGHPLANHQRIAAVWNVVLGPKLTADITPEEVVWCMIGVKLAREVNTPKRDNALDVAGYINCLDLIQQARENREANQ
jgi:hypothetical protein